ncbi:PREDICTED: WASH complex subunit FAM21 [Nicrophorus vespilloides]|uniref:WASH complex subunit FAM21 n=1 Tax=Nicrophorus vespilloides TaxID=110193 RepID=A0ABM1NHT2_NICVS|nr:PREDICTED: WASH complex subunit FAM21 [Nicrophorus vespilloides]
MAMSKDWEHPWTIEEIVENAPNWNLAGDAGLLRHLEQFSENLFKRAGEVNGSLDELLDNLDKTAINLDLVKNQFLSLQNTQFIESRVYEDDEVLDSKKEDVTNVEKKVLDEEKKKNITNAVLKGIELLDEYYDKVTVDGSDSEDDVDGVSYVLQPKNPYLQRPLPYVIGTEQWYKNWHVGLEDSSSEEEAEEPDKFSDTDSESNLPIADRRRIESTSDSGTDVSLNHSKPQAVINDTDSSGTDNSIPVKMPPSSQSFADQLAARLGNIAVESTKELEVNRRPINIPKPQVGLFTNEPPPLEESEDDEDKQGMFSGGKDLFQNEDVSFWGQKNPPQYDEPKKKTRGLFDESDDEEAFTSSNQTQPNSFLKPYTNNTLASSFLSNEPPEIIEAPKTKKEPSAGIIGRNSTLAGILPKRTDSSSEEEVIIESSKSIVEDKTAVKSVSKKPSLFDDADDLFKDDLFSDVKTFSDKKKLSLFDNDDDDEAEESFPKIEKRKENLFDSDEDIFTSSKVEQERDHVKRTFVPSLFDDAPPDLDDWDTKSDNNDLDDDDIYDTKKEVDQNQKKFSLFDDEPPDFDFVPKNASIFDDTDDAKIKSGGLFDDDLDFKKANNKMEINLFSDDDLEKNRLFEDKNVNLFDDKEEEIPSVDDQNKTNDIPSVIAEDCRESDVVSEVNKEITVEVDTKPNNQRITKKKISLFDDDLETEDLFAKVIDNEETKKDIVKNQDDVKSVENNNSKLTNKPIVIGRKNTLAGALPKRMDSSSDDDLLFSNAEVRGKAKSVDLFDSEKVDDEDKLSESLPNDDFFSAVTDHEENNLQDCKETKSIDLFGSEKKDIENPKIEGNNTLSKPMDNSSDDDLFSSAIDHEETNLLDDTQRDQNKSKEVDLLQNNEEAKLTNKPIVLPRKVAKMKENLSEDSSRKPEEKVLPSKLKHNLNINVAALMPGASLPKSFMVKSHSLEDAKVEQPLIVHAQSNKDVRLPEDAPEDNLLPSITKSRARIAVKRKPSTRRGRQESIRRNRERSEDRIEDTKNNNVERNLDFLNRNATQSEISQIGDEDKNERSKPDGGNEKGPVEYEDFLNDSYSGGIHRQVEMPPKATSSLKKEEPKKKETLKKEAPKKMKGLFDDDDIDIFADLKKTSSAKRKKPKGLFDDDDEDDIFGNVSEVSSASTSKKPVKSNSLFDDVSDDNDDIFSTKRTASVKPTKPAEKKRISKTVPLTKSSDDGKILDDPLDLFTNQ